MRKTVYIIIVALIALLAAAVIYFGRETLSILTPEKTAAPGSTITTITPTPAAESRLKAISSKPVFGYWPGKDGDKIYYLSEEGEIVKINLSDQKEEVLFSGPLYDIAAAVPSPNGEEVIVGFGRPPVWSRFVIEEKIWKPIPAADAAGLAWLSDKKIVLLKNNSGGNGLSAYDLSKEKGAETSIMTLGIKDAQITAVLGGKKAVVSSKPTAAFESFVFLIDLEKKIVALGAGPAKGLLAEFSPFGKALLYKGGRKLSVITDDGRAVADLSLATLPSKCGWRDESLFVCAVWRDNLNNSVNLPDDYLKGEILGANDFFSVELKADENGELTASKIFSPELSVEAERIAVAGGKVFFINRQNGRLYYFSL